MLSNIHIENIAVIKNIDVDLSGGFCAVTGETGAGKTVIMDAIKLLVGAKTDRDLIRRGEEKALVSGLFTDLPDSTVAQLRELGYDCDDGELLVSRTITSDGRSSVRLNGRSATAQIQKAVVGTLLDFHGQHDNVTLLQRRTHLRMLDEYAGVSEELSLYRGKYAVFTETQKKLATHLDSASRTEREHDYLLAQIKEIEAAKPKEGEEELLECEQLRLSNIEKIRKQAAFAYRALYGGEKGNACMLIDKSILALTSVSDAVPEFAELSGRLKNAYYELADIAQTAETLADTEGEDPTVRLDKIEARLDTLRKLKKKYGSDIGEILSYLADIKKKTEAYENFDEITDQLKRSYKESLTELENCAQILSGKRLKAAKELSRSVGEVLSFLDMPKVHFEARVTGLENSSDREQRYTADGADDVVFMLSMSDKEPMLELSSASGGEIARVMLALKSVLCEKYGSQTVIYDEIDAGVSGKTARKIGLKLKESAKNTQVICVTHSAQIASLSDVHYKISKKTVDSRLESEITILDRDGRVEELSRILGGLSVTDAQRQAALDMLECEQ